MLATVETPKAETQEHLHNTGASKVDVYKWGVKDQRGTYRDVPKRLLNVDHEYQRTKVSNSRVLEIAKDWSWVACNTLAVARRLDGTLWVMDGQHRKLAADKRDDIQDLPCLVFPVTEKVEEAKGFLNTNIVRGPVSMYDRFNAMVMAGDEHAQAVKRMVEHTGFTIGRTATANSVACLKALLDEHRRNSVLAGRIWQLTVAICQGEPVVDRLYSGLCYLEHFMVRNSFGSLLEAHNREKLIQAGATKIVQKIHQFSAYYGKGGAKVWAQGIADLLNHQRRTRRIGNVVGATNAGDSGDA